MRDFRFILIGLLAICLALRLSAAVVTNLNDSGPGSLRAALAAGGNVEFTVTGTINLTSGQLEITHPLTIIGPGAELLAITRSSAAGMPEFRVLRVAASPVTISGLTIQNGLLVSNPANGAGILNEGALTLNDCIVRRNRGTDQLARGAGLFNANHATLTLNRCVIAENIVAGDYSDGAGLYAFGTVTVSESSFRSNRCEGWYSLGGGLHVDYYGSAAVARCTFDGNSASGVNAQGGGIYCFGQLEIVNSTVSGNTAGGAGGGITVDTLASGVSIRNCTVSGNFAKAAAGLFAAGNVALSAPRGGLTESILAGNTPDDLGVAGILVSSGHNLLGQVYGGFFITAPGDQLDVTVDALQLAPLANNGGPTQTRALRAGSLAIDAGSETNFPATDQRGVARPFGSRPDIGAFEFNALLSSNLPPSISFSSPPNGLTSTAPANIVLTAVVRDADGSVANAVVEFFSGVSQLGRGLLVDPASSHEGQFRYYWTNVPVGEYTLTARVTDDKGAAAITEPLSVTVRASQPTTNQLPKVTVVSPTNGMAYTLPAVIQLCADARDEDGFVDWVDFYVGTNWLGSRTNCLPCASIQNPFCLAWSNPPPGEYLLTAAVTDNQGARTVSEPVHVVVRESGSNQLSFRLALNNPNANGGVFFQDYTLQGPTDGVCLLPADRVVAAVGDRYFYGAKPHLVWRADRQTGAIQMLNPGPDLPVLSWPMGVAFDSHRQRLLLASLGGEGVLYGYTPASNLWSVVRTLNNRDVDCIVYHASQDTLYGVKVTWGPGASALYRFTPGGEFLGEIPLPELPFGIGPGGYISELVSVGDYLVLLLEADLELDPYGESRIYMIDPRTATAQLTYRHQRLHPNQPPFVQINSPQTGTAFTAPAEIHLAAYAQDQEDGNDLSVEFYAGTNSLGFGTFVPSLCPSPYCPFYALTWSNVPPGHYVVSAHATDKGGETSISAPVEITVVDQSLDRVTIHATDESASEGGGSGLFLVSREGNKNRALQVFYAIAGTASNGVDYVALSNSVVVPEGKAAAIIEVKPIEDTIFEGPETVELQLLPPTLNSGAYLLGTPSNAVVRITDNDDPLPLPVITIEASDTTASEIPGDTGQFRIRRTGATNQALYLYLEISGTASNGVDYVTLSNVVVLPAGKLVAELPVTPLDDTLVEGPETVVATLYYPPFAGPLPPPYIIGSPSNAVVTILDNDPVTPPHEPAVVTVEATDPFARETGLLTVVEPGVFTIRRSGNTNVALHVQCATEGTASNGVDYITISNLVVMPAGVIALQLPVYPLNDNLTEGTETVTLRVLPPMCIAIYPPPPECYQVGVPDSATVYISDPDVGLLPSVSIIARDPVASEGTNCLHWIGWPSSPTAAFCGTNTATFVIRRTGRTNAPLNVTYEISGTASNGVDYVRLSGVVTIPAGGRTAEVVIAPLDDTVPEGTETIRLALHVPPSESEAPLTYTLGWPTHAEAILVDNDRPRPLTGLLPDWSFHFTRPGANGSWFRIETSTDLVQWTVLCTNLVTDGAVHFVDPDSADQPSRFYRVVPEPIPPPE